MEQDYEEVVRLLENELAEVRMQASKALVCFKAEDNCCFIHGELGVVSW